MPAKEEGEICKFSKFKYNDFVTGQANRKLYINADYYKQKINFQRPPVSTCSEFRIITSNQEPRINTNTVSFARDN